jgi:hypothetical protein
MRGHGHRAVTANDDDRIELIVGDVFEAAVGDIANLGCAVDFHMVTAGIDPIVGAENGAAQGQNIADRLIVERPHAVLNQAQETIFDTHDLQAATVERRFRHRADDCIQSWAITACR